MARALSEFGKLVMERVRAEVVRDWVSTFRTPLPHDPDTEDVKEVLATLNEAQIEAICRIVPRIVDRTIWYMLLLFEEKYEQVQIRFNSESQGEVDLWEKATGDLQGYIFSWLNEYGEGTQEK